MRQFGPGHTYYGDSSYVCKGVRRDVSTWPLGTHPDLWMTLADVLQGQACEVVKVKAHADASDLLHGRISLFQLVGNSVADTFDAKGAKLYEVSADFVATLAATDARAQNILHRNAPIALHCAETTPALEKQEAVPRRMSPLC